MNKDRRQRIADASKALANVLGIIEGCAEEERDAFENLTDSLQQTERGQESEQAADALEEAVESLNVVFRSSLQVLE